MLVEHIVTSRLTAARRLFIDQSKSVPVSFTTVVWSRHATALFPTWKRTRCVTRLNNGSEGDKVSLFPKLICLFEDNDKKKQLFVVVFSQLSSFAAPAMKMVNMTNFWKKRQTKRIWWPYLTR